MAEKDTLDIPSDQKGSFASFLKTLSSFTGDISSLTCPSFLLAPISLLEYSAFWADRPDLLNAIGESDDPEERFYAAIKWFISAINGSFSSRVPKGEWEKKPFNPILGEQFLCNWKDDKGVACRIVCEQVSHHPPVSGFYIENEKADVVVVGHDGQKTRFSGTQMIVEQIGYCTLKLDRFDETYLFTLPTLSVNGIIYAAPYVELQDKSYVQSSSGYHAEITYSTKGWVYGGELHHFKAEVTHEKLSGPTIIEGQWTAKSHITKHKGSAKPFLDLKDKRPTFDINVEEKDQLDSRKVWEKVATSLKEGDYQAASEEKSRVENEQRAIRKDRQDNGTEWEPKHFKKVQGDVIYGNLGATIIKKADPKIQIERKMGAEGWQHRET